MQEKEIFINKIQSERKRIKKFESALSNMDKSNIKGIRIGKIHLANMYLNCIRLTYSIFREYDRMYPDYIKFLEYYREICTPNDSMYDIIDILSIGVLLDNKKDEFINCLEEIVTKFNSMDGIIIIIMNYLKNVKDFSLDNMISKIEYINELVMAENKEEVLQKALRIWYEEHRDAYWYDAHKKNNATFCGYWSYEIAAFVKIYNLDDTSFQDELYYPYDLVRYKE